MSVNWVSSRYAQYARPHNTLLQFLKITFDRHSVLLYQYTHALNQCGTHKGNKHHDHRHRHILHLRNRNWHFWYGRWRPRLNLTLVVAGSNLLQTQPS
jgi:hypothetical protein